MVRAWNLEWSLPLQNFIEYPPFPLRLVSVVSIGVKEYLPGFSLLNALNNTSLICITVFHHNQQKTSKSDNSHSRLQIKWKKKTGIVLEANSAHIKHSQSLGRQRLIKSNWRGYKSRFRTSTTYSLGVITWLLGRQKSSRRQTWYSKNCLAQENELYLFHCSNPSPQMPCFHKCVPYS